ncbi:MAG: hypothetical protein ACSHW0_02075 [Thalassotalea sp.]
MTYFFRRRYKALFGGLWLFLSVTEVNALGLSTYRIYLDKEHNEQNFIVYNRDDSVHNCRIYKRHFIFDEIGNISLHEGEDVPDIAADDFIRFSPRSFRVESGKVQTVRFKLRRKSNLEAKEYRSYISLDCDIEKSSATSNLKGNTHLSPKLRHNVPVVVRTGDIPAELYFDQVTVDNNILKFNFNKKGLRSTYGELLLIDKSTNKVISKKPSVSLPLETRMMSSSFSLKDLDVNDLTLSFVEDEKLSGKQVIQFPLKKT